MGNRSVYGLGKWYAKFRTGKFSSGIAFTICTDQFHLTENGREGLKLVSKMALRKWNTNFRLEYFVRKNRTTFSDVPLLQEIFRWEDPKSRVPFTVCLRADVSYFLCCTRKRDVPFPRARKEIGDVCTQAIYFRTGFPGKFLSKGHIPGRARLKERLSRSKLKQAFLLDSDAELVIRLMKSSASEPGLRIHLVMATTSLIYGSVVSP